MFVTFYSYRGGLGKTSALINTAYYLSQTGRDVCIIDFHLDAPGLHKSPLFKDEVNKKSGLVEYITEYVDKKEIIKVKDYLINTKVEVNNETIRKEKPTSRLSLLKAGNLNKGYIKKLSEINWEELYRDYYGYFLFEILKKELKEELKFDYIFIDSQPGFNEISGICTKQIPDTIALFFGLNEQNFDGINSIYENFKNPDNNKKNDKKEIDIINVVSPLNEFVINNLDEKIKKLTNIVGAENLQAISYSPLLSDNEMIVFQHKYQHLISLTNQYISLANRITFKNIDNDKNELRDYIISNIEDLSKQKDLLEKSKRIFKLNPLSIDYYNHSLLLLKKKDLQESKDYIEKAINIDKENINYLMLEIYILKERKLDYEDKIKNLENYIEINPKILGFIFHIYMNYPKYDKAKEMAKKYPLFNKHISDIYLLKEDYEKSLENTDLQDKDKLINIYHKMLNFKYLLPILEESLKEDPSNTDYIELKVRSFRGIGEFKKAVLLCEDYLKNNPESYNFNYLLSLLYLDVSNEEKSLEYINKSLKIYPSSIDANIIKLKLYFNLDDIKNFDSTLQTLEYLILVNSNKSVNIPFILELLVSKPEYKDKTEFYYKILQNLNISRQDTDIYITENNYKYITRGLALSSMFLHKFDKAIELYSQKEIIKDYLNDLSYFNLAMACLFTNKLELAKSNFKKSISPIERHLSFVSFKDKANYFLCYSIALYFSDKKEKAIQEINKCLDLIKSNENIKYIFSPKDYKLIKRNSFIELCNDLLYKMKENKQLF